MGKARDLARLNPNSSGQLPTTNLTYTPVNKAGDTITGRVAFSNALTNTNSFSIATADTTQWVRIGKISGTTAAGGALKITVLGAFGYNALPVQAGYDEIVVRGSNNGSSPGRNVGGRFYRVGNMGHRVIFQVKLVAVSGSAYADEYYVFVQAHTALWANSDFKVEVTTNWTWTWDVATGQSDPGNASSTVAVLENTFAVGADNLEYNNYPAYMCRAWVNFNGKGTIAIRGSGNVSSITDNGVGRYAMNFTTGMPDTNYSFHCGAGAWTDGGTNFYGSPERATGSYGAAITTSSIRFTTCISDVDMRDGDVVYAQVFR